MKKRLKYSITGLLIFCIINLSLKSASNTTNPSNDAKPKSIVLVCAVAVAVAAGYVVYSLYRCAQTAGLTGTNAPPPPPQKPASGSAILFPKDGPTPPVNTNIPPASTNIVKALTIIYSNDFLATNNDQAVELKQDISTNGWVDWQGKPYTWFFTTQTDTNGPHVQTSTNLLDWSDATYKINIWLSSTISPDTNLLYLTNMCVVQYDENNIPLLTNWSAITTNAPVNAGVRNAGSQFFFRGVTP